MPARAIWKGVLVMGTETVPVKLYSAVEDRSIHFHVLEKSNLMRIRQHLVDPETGEQVPSDQVQKGYEAEPGVYVRLTAEEILKVSDELKIDLIAISTHGRSGLTRWAYGSVADRILRGGNTPVFMVRAAK